MDYYIATYVIGPQEHVSLFFMAPVLYRRPKAKCEFIRLYHKPSMIEFAIHSTSSQKMLQFLTTGC